MTERTYTIIRTQCDGQRVMVSRCHTSEEARGLVASLHERSPGDYTIESSWGGSAETSVVGQGLRMDRKSQ